MSVWMCWIQIKMGHPVARHGASLAPFRTNGAHPSSGYVHLHMTGSGCSSMSMWLHSTQP